MSFNIVCDSCTDLTKEDFEKGCYTWIPLTLLIGDEEIVDDDTFDQHSFLEKWQTAKEPASQPVRRRKLIWKHIKRQMIFMW